MCFVKQSKIDAKRGVGPLSTRDRLEHKVNRRTLLQCCNLRGDMSKNAALRRNRVAFPNRLHEFKQPSRAGHAIRHRIYPDNRIARSKQQAINDAGRDPDRIIRGMIRLQPS
jgi:hypothetical protein